MILSINSIILPILSFQRLRLFSSSIQIRLRLRITGCYTSSYPIEFPFPCVIFLFYYFHATDTAIEPIVRTLGTSLDQCLHSSHNEVAGCIGVALVLLRYMPRTPGLRTLGISLDQTLKIIVFRGSLCQIIYLLASSWDIC